MTEQEARLLEQWIQEQKRISKELIKAKGGTFIKMGKTKAIGALPNDKVIMRFLDSYTGTNGTKDGGGNDVAGYQEGLGFQNLATTWKIFELLNRECDIPTQNVAMDEKNNLLIASALELLGANMPFRHAGQDLTSGGVEIIARNTATGSILKRMPYLNEGADLTDEKSLPMIETSVKHDAAGDPMFAWQYFVQQGVNKNDLQTAMERTARGTKFLTEKFARLGLNFIDTKMEHGYTKKGRLVLGDEISTGTSRLRDMNGGKLTEKQIYEAVMKM
jgi:phosphoribosylaminoimidazole-succinocarboxamide synthase